MNDPQDTVTTLTDDQVTTTHFGTAAAVSDDTGDDSGDVADPADTGDDASGPADSGDDSGDVADPGDAGDDS
jgi:hypothetical protein